jgi:hypothetical protein
MATALGGAVLRMLLVAYFVLPPTANHAQAPGTVSFQLPLTRAGDRFDIHQKDGNGGFITIPITPEGIANAVLDENTNVVTPTAQSYLQGSAQAPTNDYYIEDKEDEQTTPMNILGTPSFSRTSFLTTPWYTKGVDAATFYMVLPADRMGHDLSVVTSGAAYLETTSIRQGPQLAYETVDGSGQPVLAYYGFFDGAIPVAPSGAWFVLDSTNHEQSRIHAPSEHDLVSAETWTSFTGVVPTRLLTIVLDDSEGPANFMLHTTAGSFVSLTPQWEWDATLWRYAYRISATLGVNQPFWLERQQDGATTALARIGLEDLTVNATNAFAPYLPPVVAQVEVGENHWHNQIVFDMSNGTSVTAQPDMNTWGYTQFTDYLNRLYYSFGHVTFTATVPGNLTYAARDATTGGASLMEGYNPPAAPAPNPQTFVVTVGENHWNDSISVLQQDGTSIGPNVVDGGYQTANDSLGVPYYYYGLRYYYFTVDANQTYSLYDGMALAGNLMDGFNPPYNPYDPADFGSLNVEIAACRWNHTFQVQTSYGDVWPISVEQMQGYWTIDQNGQSSFVSYFCFDATGQSRVGFDWWIYDVTVGDFAPANTHDLSNWLYPGATTDSDYDGLFDWHELLLGLNPYSPDSDSDGLPDAWELAHGYDPHNPADGLADPDNDGLTNGQEYALGTKFDDADSDWDGMPDGWEVSHMLNPRVNDAYQDPDFDGLWNITEFVIGTNPQLADSDTDGFSDSWELEHGGDPTRPGTWAFVPLPAGRAFHHLTLWRHGQASSCQPRLEADTGWVMGYVELFDSEPLAVWDPVNQWSYLIDDVTGERLMSNELSWYAPDAEPWQPASPELAPIQHLLFPSDRASHSFVLVSGDVCYPVTVSIPDFGACYGAGCANQSGYFAVASGSYTPGLPYALLDLSLGQISPLGGCATNLLNVAWSSHGIASFVDTVIRVGDNDFGREFMIASGDSFVWRTASPSVDGGEMVISAPVPFGQRFAVNRAEDGAKVDLASGIELSAYFNLSTAMPPLDVAYTRVTIDAGVNHTGVVAFTYEGDLPTSQSSLSTVTGWNAYGQTVNSDFYTYAATVPIWADYHFRDDQGNIDEALRDHLRFDVPPNGQIEVQLPYDRSTHQIELRQFIPPTDPSSPRQLETAWLLAPVRDPGTRHMSNLSIYSGMADANPYAGYDVPYVKANAVYDAAKPIEVWDLDTGEVKSLPPNLGVIDLTEWVPAQSITVYISATRWDHEFELHSDHGDPALTLNKGAMQGHYVMGGDPTSQDGGFTTYWYFDATVTLPPGRATWWVYDTTANERAAGPDNEHNLSQWLSADPNHDGDDNGVPDWYQHLLSTGFSGTGTGTGGSGTGSGSGAGPPTGPSGGAGGTGSGTTGINFGYGPGNGSPTGPHQWPQDDDLRRPRQPVTSYAVIPLYVLKPGEFATPLMLNESSEVAFQINNDPDPTKNKPRGYFWAPGDAEPQEMLDSSPPYEGEHRSFGSIKAITDGGEVLGMWPSYALGSTAPCTFVGRRYERLQAMWLRTTSVSGARQGSLRYVDPALPGYHVTEDYPGQVFIDHLATVNNVDNWGRAWMDFTVSGQFKSREFVRHVPLCPNDEPPNPNLTGDEQPVLAAGSFGGIGYGSGKMWPPDLDSGTEGALWTGLLSSVAAQRDPIDPPPEKDSVPVDYIEPERVFVGSSTATLVNFDNSGHCLAFWNGQLMVSEGAQLTPLKLEGDAIAYSGQIAAMGDTGLILTHSSILKKAGASATAGYLQIPAPYDRQWVPTGEIGWQAFDDETLTAVGTQKIDATDEYQAVIMKNGAALPLSDLCAGHPRIEFPWAPGRAQLINKNGMMVAVADTARGPAVALLVPFGLTIDADNNNGYDEPDRTYEEVSASVGQVDESMPEHLKNSIGKMVDVGSFMGDNDGDGVPNHAEGLSQNGNTALYGGTNVNPARFIPVILQLPLLGDFSKMKVQFDYAASDPALVTSNADSNGAPQYQAAPGAWRLWTKRESALRKVASVAAGGDYVPGGVPIPVSHLGQIRPDGSATFYVECVGSADDCQIGVQFAQLGAADVNAASPPVRAWQVQIVDKAMNPVKRLRVAKMFEPGVLSRQARTGTALLAPVLDSDRFYIRIPGAAHLGRGTVKVVTRNNPDAKYNDSIELELHVKGNNLITRPILLVSGDIDDGHEWISDDSSGKFLIERIGDGQMNDPTINVQLGGLVKIDFLKLADVVVPAIDYGSPEVAVPFDKEINVKIFNGHWGIVDPKKKALNAQQLKDQIEKMQELYAPIALKVNVEIADDSPDLGTFNGTVGQITAQFDGLTSKHVLVVPRIIKTMFDLHPVAEDVVGEEVIGIYAVETFPGGDKGQTTVPKYLTKDDRDNHRGNKIIIARDASPQTSAHELLHVLLNAEHPTPMFPDNTGGDFKMEFGIPERLWHVPSVWTKSILDSKRISDAQEDSIMGLHGKEKASKYPH